MVKVMDKSTGPSKQTSSAQASPSKSVCPQIDTKYTSIVPLQGLIGSEVWVENAIDYSTRDDTILSEMRDSVDSLYAVCDDIT